MLSSPYLGKEASLFWIATTVPASRLDSSVCFINHCTINVILPKCRLSYLLPLQPLDKAPTFNASSLLHLNL